MHARTKPNSPTCSHRAPSIAPSIVAPRGSGEGVSGGPAGRSLRGPGPRWRHSASCAFTRGAVSGSARPLRWGRSRAAATAPYNNLRRKRRPESFTRGLGYTPPSPPLPPTRWGPDDPPDPSNWPRCGDMRPRRPVFRAAPIEGESSFDRRRCAGSIAVLLLTSRSISRPPRRFWLSEWSYTSMRYAPEFGAFHPRVPPRDVMSGNSAPPISSDTARSSPLATRGA